MVSISMTMTTIITVYLPHCSCSHLKSGWATVGGAMCLPKTPMTSLIPESVVDRNLGEGGSRGTVEGQ